MLGVVLLTALLAGAAPARAFDHEHAAFAAVLDRFVENGLVDYAALRRDRKALDRYLASLAGVSRDDLRAWTKPRQIAFYLNLYNAWTLRLIIDHYPVRSIKDIGGFFSGPWKQEIVRLFGETVTLDHVEHGILRKEYVEPRVHFALVCAARGCPPLRSEPYVEARLDAQLDEQGRRFLAERDKNRVDAAARTLYLSPIFKWFREDFTSEGKPLAAFVRPFLPERASWALEDDFAIHFTDYDWSLNERRPGEQEES